MSSILPLKKKASRLCKMAVGMLACMGFVNTVLAAPLAGSYTINSGLPTAGRNFASFNDAVYALEGGITAPVEFEVTKTATPYNDQVTIYEVPGASATNTVTFKGNGATLEFLSTNEEYKAGIKLDGARHIIFDNLTVHCLASDKDFEYGYGFNLIRNSDHNIIRNCTVINLERTTVPQKTAGIVINGSEKIGSSQYENTCDSNLIMNNTIIGGYEGIVVDKWSNSTTTISLVYGNQIIGNTIRDVQHSSIRLLWTGGTIVRGNDITGRFYTETSTFGIWVIEANYDLVIDGNRFHDFFLAETPQYVNNRRMISFGSVIAPEGKENYVINNQFDHMDIANDEVTVIEINSGSSGLRILHNTFSFDNNSAASGELRRAVYVENSSSTNVQFFNNIVSITGGGSGTKYAVQVDAVTPGFSSDYNNYFITANKGNTGRYAGATGTSVAQWQAVTGYDLHSVNINPMYVSWSTGDLMPANNVLDNFATYKGVAKDKLGVARPNTYPDMGAYEFLSTPCSTPPVGGKILALPSSSVCANTGIVINLDNNSAGDGQLFQWQTSTTLNGTYTNAGDAAKIPLKDIVATTTLYYRCALTCAGVTGYSDTLAIIANTALPASTFTINKNQPTSGTNFSSFNDALSVLKCGVSGPIVFNVEKGSGPYNEQLIIPAIPGTSATNTVTFNGNGETLSYRSTASTQRAVIKLNGADYFTFDNLKIWATGGSGAYGYGVHLMNDADNNTINNCTIIMSDTTNGSSNHVGILVNASHNNPTNTTTETNLCDNNKFTGNTITGGIYGIVVMSNVAPNNVSNYNISNNVIKDFYQYGMYIGGIDNVLVEGNDISRPNRAPVPGSTRQNIEAFNGIYVKNKTTRLTISKNKIHDASPKNPNGSGANGIYFDNADGNQGTENIVSNNLIYDFITKGTLYGIYNSGSDSVRYYHNTIVLNDQGFTGSSTTRGIYQTGAAKGIVFKNNNVSITRSGNGKKHGIYLNTATTTYEADNNNYYINGPDAATNFVGYLSSDRASIKNWQDATGKEAKSLAKNPYFADSANADYSPMLMELDNAGAAVGILTDIKGVTRSISTPDIGAFEFSGTLPVTLVSFGAVKAAGDAIVSWTSSLEINSKVYLVERSFNGIDFAVAGTVSAKGAGAYHYTDAGVIAKADNKLYYRLKMVDKDGSFKYSGVVTIVIGSNNNNLISVYPNPVTADLFVNINSTTTGIAKVTISSVSGAVIATRQLTVASGASIVRLHNMSQQPSGFYLVTVERNGNRQSFKVFKK